MLDAMNTQTATSETTSPTSRDTKPVSNKRVDADGSKSPAKAQPTGAGNQASSKKRPRNRGNKKKGGGGPKTGQQMYAAGPTLRLLSENDDPIKVLWRAIHLEQDAAVPSVTVDDVLKHPRLTGAILAAAEGRSRIDVIQAASRIGVDFETIKDSGCHWNVLHAAVSSGCLAMLGTLLDECSSDQIAAIMNEYSALLGTTKWTPLLLAVKNGFHEAVELLLRHGADPNLAVHLVTPDVKDKKTGEVINNKEGQVYPLFFAIKNCPVYSVKIIYEAMTQDGHIPIREILDSKGRTAIHYLSERPVGAEGSAHEVFQYLLSLDPELHTLSDLFGNTPLHECCRRGNDEMTLNFLAILNFVGVDLHEECLRLNKDDLSPLLIATCAGMSGSVQYFLDYGTKSIFQDDKIGSNILASLGRGEVMHAINLVTINTTTMDEFEKGAFNAFIGLTNEPDQAQLVRIVKRLGAYYCMSFIAEFTVSDLSTNSPAKIRKDNQKPRTKGGHFLTLLKQRLVKEDRQEDWTYIRVVNELTHKKQRGRPIKKVAKKDYAMTLIQTANLQ